MGTAEDPVDPFLHMDQGAGRMLPPHSAMAHTLQALLPNAEQGVTGVRAQFSDGRVRASLEAATSNAMSGLTGQLPQLHQFLGEQGIALHRLEIERSYAAHGETASSSGSFPGSLTGSQSGPQQSSTSDQHSSRGDPQARNADARKNAVPTGAGTTPLARVPAEAGRAELSGGHINIRA
jgi:hypothetical protein